MPKETEQILKDGTIEEGPGETYTRKGIYDFYVKAFGSFAVRKDKKQIVLYEKVGVLSANITYLGNPHPINKKRMQLKKDYPEYVRQNKSNGLKTIFVGFYKYKDTALFVVFEPSTYLANNLNNSSAHVYSVNLQCAQRQGQFFKRDASGNNIHIFDFVNFKEFIQSLCGRGGHVPFSYEDIVTSIGEYMKTFLKQLPKCWEGVKAYKEMKADECPNARQNRWPGWYFEYRFQKYLKSHPTPNVSWCSDKKSGGVDLDVVFSKEKWIYGDLKADRANEDILGNKFETFDKVINDHNGVVYYICVRYKAEKDTEHNYVTTEIWNAQRDKDKQYKTSEEIKKAARSMPYSVEIEEINILRIDKSNYGELKKDPFFQGHNPNGRPRKPKLKVKKNLIAQYTVWKMNTKGQADVDDLKWDWIRP